MDKMESITNENEIESKSGMKGRRFPKTYSMCVRALFKIKGSLAGKEVSSLSILLKRIIMLVLNVLTN